MITVIDDMQAFIQQSTLEFIIMNPTAPNYSFFFYDEKKEREKKRQEWLQSLSKKRKGRK